MKKRFCIASALVACCICSIGFASTPYDDVPLDHWAYDAVSKLTKDGIIDGYPDGTFGGDKPITRFEMAKMIREAVVSEERYREEDRRLLDRLAKEYAEELKGFNVRIVELERRVGNVRWNGNIRYRYVRDKHDNADNSGGFMGMFGGGGNQSNHSHLQYLTARLEPDIKIADHWTGHMRLNYNIDLDSGKNGLDNIIGGNNNNGGFMAMFGMGGDDNSRKVKGFSVDRLYLQGDYKNLNILLGRLPYLSKIDKGLVFDDSVTGGQVTYGSKYKATVTAGRIDNDPYGVNDDDNGGMMGMFGIGNTTDTKTGYFGTELYTEQGKLLAGVGYHHFGNRNFDDNGGGFMAMFGGGGNAEKQPADIFSVGANYRFTKKFGMGAAAAWNTKKDMGYDGSKRAWNIELEYGKADPKVNRSFGAFMAYRHLGNSVTWRSEYDTMDSGQKGWEFGASYVFAKNIMGTIRYFNGKDIKTNIKANSFLTELNCYF